MILIRIVNSIFDSNTYILQDEHSKDAYLVDIGDIEPIVSLGLAIKGVFITHGHFDHIYGLPELVSCYPDCKIYTSSIGREFLASEMLNLSRYHGTPINFSGSQIVDVSEGSFFVIFGELQVEIFETPGHNPSCLVFRIGKYLFTGDAYIPNLKVITNLPKANKDIALKSEKRIVDNLIEKQTIICAGHGNIVSSDKV